jgi:hypothetical protein
MRTRLKYAAAIVLVAHGFVHLLGTVAYLELAAIEELPYKTTLFGGHVDVGDTGIRIFGLLWGLASIVFVTSAVALVFDRGRWRSLLLVVTLFSLLITVVDWTVAYAGIVVNLAILGGLWFETRRKTE